MVDMLPKDILKEWEKCFPDKEDGYGYINIDIAALCPDEKLDGIELEFGLVKEYIQGNQCMERGYPELLMARDTMVCHRYPNRRYATLSRSFGGRPCLTGYPLCGPIDKLNGYRMLVMKRGYKDWGCYMVFPTSFRLTGERPVAGLSLTVYDWESAGKVIGGNFGISIQTAWPDKETGRYSIREYLAGKPEPGYQCARVMLSAGLSDMPDTVLYSPMLKPEPQPLDRFLLI